ncbi:MAG: circadian clock KaiB family protein [Bryobacteraceae bacterium]|nr:circadian clock KaiB family protein [Bryobacteraceae bacterium]
MKRLKTADSTKAFEDALAEKPDVARYYLRLFITGTTPRCARAIENIRAICEANLPGRYDLEVIDIYQHPEQAKPEQIVVTPTLVKKLPLPFRRMIGDLSDNERVLVGLDIVRSPRPATAPEKEHGT